MWRIHPGGGMRWGQEIEAGSTPRYARYYPFQRSKPLSFSSWWMRSSHALQSDFKNLAATVHGIHMSERD